jgi:hypothetical protein
MELPTNYDNLHSEERRIVREQYVKLQQGNCYHCHGPLDQPAAPAILNKWVNKKLFPTHFFQHPVHLHHDHNTGLTIGAVHCHCNAVLWQYLGE